MSAGSAVLVERGGCTFLEKARAVQAANASILLVYNDDDGALPIACPAYHPSTPVSSV